MYGTRLQMKEEIFFWWGQPSPIDIVNCNSVGKGSKKKWNFVIVQICVFFAGV